MTTQRVDSLGIDLGLNDAPYQRGIARAEGRWNAFEQRIMRTKAVFDSLSNSATEALGRMQQAIQAGVIKMDAVTKGLGEGLPQRLESLTRTVQLSASQLEHIQNRLSRNINRTLSDRVDKAVAEAYREGDLVNKTIHAWYDRQVAIIQAAKLTEARMNEAFREAQLQRDRMLADATLALKLSKAKAEADAEERLAAQIQAIRDRSASYANRSLRGSAEQQIRIIDTQIASVKRMVDSLPQTVSPGQKMTLQAQAMAGAAEKWISLITAAEGKTAALQVQINAGIEARLRQEVAVHDASISAAEKAKTQKELIHQSYLSFLGEMKLRVIAFSEEQAQKEAAAAIASAAAKEKAERQVFDEKVKLTRQGLKEVMDAFRLETDAAAQMASAVLQIHQGMASQLATIFKVQTTGQIESIFAQFRHIQALIDANLASRAPELANRLTAQNRELSKTALTHAMVVESAKTADAIKATEIQLNEYLRQVRALRHQDAVSQIYAQSQSEIQAVRTKVQQISRIIGESGASIAQQQKMWAQLGTAFVQHEYDMLVQAAEKAAQHRIAVEQAARDRIAQLDAELATLRIRATHTAEEAEVIAVANATAKRIALARQEATSREEAELAVRKLIAIQEEEITAIRARHAEQRRMIEQKEVRDRLTLHGAINRGIKYGLRGIATQLQVIAGLYVSVLSFRGLEQGLIETNAQLEKMKIGISAVVQATSHIVDKFGNELPQGLERFHAAQRKSNQLVEQFRVDAFKTVFTSQQLTEAATMLAPIVFNAGKGMEDLRRVTNLTATTAAVLGLRLTDAARQVQEIVTGAHRVTTPLVRLLGGKEELEEVLGGAHDRLAGMAQIMERFRIAADEHQKSWEGVTSQIREIYELLASVAGEAAFVAIRDDMFSLIKTVTEGNNEIQKIKPSIRQMAGQVGDHLVAAYRNLKTAVSAAADAIRVLIKVVQALQLDKLLVAWAAFRVGLMIQPIVMAAVGALRLLTFGLVDLVRGLVATTAAYGFMSTAIGTATVAMGRFWAMLRSNPLGWATIALTAYTLATMQAAHASELVVAETERLYREQETAIQTMLDNGASAQVLSQKLEDLAKRAQDAGSDTEKLSAAEAELAGVKTQIVGLGGPYAAAIQKMQGPFPSLRGEISATIVKMRELQAEMEVSLRKQAVFYQNQVKVAEERARAAKIQVTLAETKVGFKEGLARKAPTGPALLQPLETAGRLREAREARAGLATAKTEADQAALALDTMQKRAKMTGTALEAVAKVHVDRKKFASRMTGIERQIVKGHLSEAKQDLQEMLQVAGLTEEQKLKIEKKIKAIEKQEAAAARQGSGGARRAEAARTRAGKEEVADLEHIAQKKGLLTEKDLQGLEAIQRAYAGNHAVYDKAAGVIRDYATRSVEAIEHKRKMGEISAQKEQELLAALEVRLRGHGDAHEAVMKRITSDAEKYAEERRERLRMANDAKKQADAQAWQDEISDQQKALSKLLQDEDKHTTEKKASAEQKLAAMKGIRKRLEKQELDDERQKFFKDIDLLRLSKAQRQQIENQWGIVERSIREKYNRQNLDDYDAFLEQLKDLRKAEADASASFLKDAFSGTSDAITAAMEAEGANAGNVAGEALKKGLLSSLGNADSLLSGVAGLFDKVIPAASLRFVGVVGVAMAAFVQIAEADWNAHMKRLQKQTEDAAKRVEAAFEQIIKSTDDYIKRVTTTYAAKADLVELMYPNPDRNNEILAKMSADELEYLFKAVEFTRISEEKKFEIVKTITDKIKSYRDKVLKQVSLDSSVEFFTRAPKEAPGSTATLDELASKTTDAKVQAAKTGDKGQLFAALSEIALQRRVVLERSLAEPGISDRRKKELQEDLLQADADYAEAQTKLAELAAKTGRPIDGMGKAAEGAKDKLSTLEGALGSFVDRLEVLLEKLLPKDFKPPSTEDSPELKEFLDTILPLLERTEGPLNDEERKKYAGMAAAMPGFSTATVVGEIRTDIRRSRGQEPPAGPTGLFQWGTAPSRYADFSEEDQAFLDDLLRKKRAKEAPKFAKGGIVPNMPFVPGMGADQIPAWLTPGEAVVDRNTVPFLQEAVAAMRQLSSAPASAPRTQIVYETQKVEFTGPVTVRDDRDIERISEAVERKLTRKYRSG